ncbi:MAG: hypothetical protein WBM17_03995, partial [Anaerolineales bacterium]
MFSGLWKGMQNGGFFFVQYMKKLPPGTRNIAVDNQGSIGEKQRIQNRAGFWIYFGFRFPFPGEHAFLFQGCDNLVWIRFCFLSPSDIHAKQGGRPQCVHEPNDFIAVQMDLIAKPGWSIHYFPFSSQDLPQPMVR